MNDNPWILEVLCDLLRSIAESKCYFLLLSIIYVTQSLQTTTDQTKQGLYIGMHICTVHCHPVTRMPCLFRVRRRKEHPR